MKEKDRCLTIEQIWDKTHKAIYVGYERLQTRSFKDEYLNGTDIRVMKQLRNAFDLMELIQIMKTDLKIDDLYEYKRNNFLPT